MIRMMDYIELDDDKGNAEKIPFRIVAREELRVVDRSIAFLLGKSMTRKRMNDCSFSCQFL